jgi:hypothetical protein
MLTFIKEWLPSIAVILGAGWLVFQWLFGEHLRRQKEMPALDGMMSAREISVDAARSLVCVEATWRNRSPLPIPINTNASRIDVFRITESLKDGAVPLTRDSLGTPCHQYDFLAHNPAYVLEPNTESRIAAYFILPRGLYGVRMELHEATGHMRVRDLIADLRGQAATVQNQATNGTR